MRLGLNTLKVKSTECPALVSQQGIDPTSKPQGSVQTLGLKELVARPRWKGEKAHDPVPRNWNKFPRRRGLPRLPQGHSGGHTHHPMGTTSGMTLVSHHILNPRLPGLPGQGSVSLQELGD